MRLILVLLWLVAATPGQSAEPPGEGLLWNRSGLPLLFPLHVRTGPGAGYYLQLLDPKTGNPAMAAWVEGGELLRVLAPPGEWRLVIAKGAVSDWQGEAQAFGPETEIIDQGLVSFGVQGLASRQGVIIDLLGQGT